jgi:hypothetical protein
MPDSVSPGSASREVADIGAKGPKGGGDAADELSMAGQGRMVTRPIAQDDAGARHR